MPKKGQINDVTGLKFNKLTVIKRLGLWKNTRQSNWLCLCECGNTIEARSTDLKLNHTQSCGCLVGEKCAKRNQKYLNEDDAALAHMVQMYQHSAKKRNFLYRLQIEQFDEVTRRKCYYCGAPQKYKRTVIIVGLKI